MKVLLVCSAALLLGECNPVLVPVAERAPYALAANSNPPEVLWVLDKSGSMALPLDPSSPDCPVDCGSSQLNLCPASCRTRDGLVIAGVDALSSQLPLGTTESVVLFPGGQICESPNAVHPSGPGLTAPLYSARPPAGGTPTAAALRFVAALPPAFQRQRIVVLVTDGAPNCNSNNPNALCPFGQTPSSNQVAACQCTSQTCAGPSLCSVGCLDDSATVGASRELEQVGAELMVVVVGPELDASAAPFSSVRIRLSPLCATDADCGGRQCGPDGTCVDRIYRAYQLADFGPASARLENALRAQRCVWWPERQVLDGSVLATIGGTAVDPSNIALEGTGSTLKIVLSGDACAQLLANEQLEPKFQQVL